MIVYQSTKRGFLEDASNGIEDVVRARVKEKLNIDIQVGSSEYNSWKNSLGDAMYKEMGNPDKPITAEERNLIMRDLRTMHNNFIEDVAQHRNIPLEKMFTIADGSSMLGEQAKTLGLIDRIGNLIDVEQYLTKTLGEEVEICWE